MSSNEAEEFDAVKARDLSTRSAASKTGSSSSRSDAHVAKYAAKFERRFLNSVAKAASLGEAGVYVFIGDFELNQKYRGPVVKSLMRNLKKRGFSVTFQWEAGLLFGRHIIHIEW